MIVVCRILHCTERTDAGKHFHSLLGNDWNIPEKYEYRRWAPRGPWGGSPAKIIFSITPPMTNTMTECTECMTIFALSFTFCNQTSKSYYQMGDPEAIHYQMRVCSLFCVTSGLKLGNHCIIMFKMEKMISFVVSSVWAVPSANKGLVTVNVVCFKSRKSKSTIITALKFLLSTIWLCWKQIAE